MQIVHRVSVSANTEIREELAQLGIAVGSGFVTFEVDEANPAWPEIASWIARRRAVDVVSTKYTVSELADAPWFALTPAWHCGYPQPEDEYLETTYDLSGHCPECGVGAVQRAPFRMSGEPRWGKNEILQLNWVFGEYFVKPALWRRVFEPIGVRSREVLDSDGARTLSTIAQLDVTEEVDIDTAGLPFDTCSRCHRPKRDPHARGLFPRVLADDGEGLVRTREWFGSGASAHRVVLAGRSVAGALKGVNGITLKPCAKSSEPA